MQPEDGTPVVVPHLAESLVSVKVVKWLKSPGDEVKEYEVLCEMETDKVNVEMPSPLEGTLVRILVPEGETAPVGSSMCLIREEKASSEPAQKATAKLQSNEQAAHRARYSPAVLHLAKLHGVDLTQVKGTALGGRISRKDVFAYVRNRDDPKPAAADASVSRHSKLPADAQADGQTHTVPLSSLRQTIARRMSESASSIPHAWMTIEADVSRLVDLRERWKVRFASKEGVRLTITPFVIKAVINAIKDYPILNSSWDSGGIMMKKDIHLSVAVGTEESVVAPVIRHADRKTIAGLAMELDGLVQRTKAGRLTLSDLQDGTFTFNNTGVFGSVLSFPIINPPQAAILTFESVVRKPVVVGQDMVAIRSIANVCLSLDHRILDGMVCGRFLQRVKHYLEQYEPDTPIY
ncbi:2-oxo acid dehydrogenase subunit E2 [Cohnella pontilimi]|uniref:Dihydrolipoamide acetyltransferase component of pyruvate dehydrogenase complex n=1 Tax=Cohnella pontilimi TaxID=2564100 RepID=A0A4U0FGJ4_9BACL|nr:dihydrolipoamide acetyltransferase family protein [Cohnella pontilimi]TJY44018.1 2-oxo acid dehydrogenase subunit E2 [Cohnella pontilimi]